MAFNNIYKNKKVVVTGNTGFKGSWLSIWLDMLGAKVYGYSKDIPTIPSLFDTAHIHEHCQHYFGDIRAKEEFNSYIQKIQPDFIFHLAAQAIVSTSYKEPFETIETNVLGTASILESIRNITWPCTIVLITSDKAYNNVEWIWGYRENDEMGGKDIYSGSKGAAELIIKSYWHSYIKGMPNIKLGIARAGNVIGGGDWAADRIVVDSIRAFSENRCVEIRSPQATRPWQHVLEPLSGYLTLGQSLEENLCTNGEAFNFGPKAEQTKTVFQLVQDLATYWQLDPQKHIKITGNIPFEEAKLLKLNCDKALSSLKWHSTLDYNTTVKLIANWYTEFYSSHQNMHAFTVQQISFYQELAASEKINWTY